MKRVTFVFIGIMAITTFVLLSRNEIEDKSLKMVKADFKRHQTKGIYD